MSEKDLFPKKIVPFAQQFCVFGSTTFVCAKGPYVNTGTHPNKKHLFAKEKTVPITQYYSLFPVAAHKLLLSQCLITL